MAFQVRAADGGRVVGDRVPSLGAQVHFEIVPAFSDALKDEVYRIRHQVYCEELAFEPRRRDGRERVPSMINNLHSIVHPLNRAADAEAAQEATPAK